METWYHPLTKRRLDAITPAPASYIFESSNQDAVAAITRLARRLNCSSEMPDGCAICQNIASGAFPDLVQVVSEGGIGIEQIHELGYALSRRPLDSRTVRVAAISAHNGISVEAQNRLLKLLEEPCAQTILVIVSPNCATLLSTIRSRCQVIKFLPPSRQALKEQLGRLTKGDELEGLERLRPRTLDQARSWLKDPEARAVRLEELTQAERFINSGLFERMILASDFKASERGKRLVETMAEVIKTKDSAKLSILEIAARRLTANVSAKNSLEALALEL